MSTIDLWNQIPTNHLRKMIKSLLRHNKILKLFIRERRWFEQIEARNQGSNVLNEQIQGN
jgi:hypothetical protein